LFRTGMIKTPHKIKILNWALTERNVNSFTRMTRDTVNCRNVRDEMMQTTNCSKEINNS
jgi:hypothetical protein